MAIDTSRFIRPVILGEILNLEKKTRKVAFKKETKVYPLWQCRFISFPEDWLTSHLIKWQIRPTALVVAMILWQQYRLNRGRQPLKLTGHMRRKFSLRKSQVRRGLLALEKAGLITMQKFKHRSPLITIVTEQKPITPE
jgi:hypothetical protein